MTMFTKTLVSSIVASFKGEAQAIAKARNVQDQQINKALDVVTIACDKPKAEFLKGNSVKNPARAEVKALFDNLVEQGFISKASGAQYQSCFWIAFEQGVPFSRDLANKKSEAKTKTEAAPKSGPVEKTNMESLTATLQKALHQCTLLNQSMMKAALIDAIVEFIPDFKESAK